MSVMFILVVASLVFALAFLAAFMWAVRSGQFDDGYTPSVRMLFEDKPGKRKENNDNKTDSK
ncbi:MAG TPA: cbb3-type cytochrome oxidase assembly protein CcoS [Calditrichia bacterium]|nr:cbb3-type cytochrome oxidase assembly protein CcoS [Calditrichota bacterium]HQV31127.1 cbb3-type cytochrome oxidase assembly protein CcoS [Calditrichia bacterium]